MKSYMISINCGIFQEGSLFPLLFSLILMPLNNELKNTKYEYEIYEKTINNLIYMDDLKLHAKKNRELEGLLSRRNNLVMISVWNSGWINVSK